MSRINSKWVQLPQTCKALRSIFQFDAMNNSTYLPFSMHFTRDAVGKQRTQTFIWEFFPFRFFLVATKNPSKPPNEQQKTQREILRDLSEDQQQIKEGKKLTGRIRKPRYDREWEC